jgi:hypothetical protein
MPLPMVNRALFVQELMEELELVFELPSNSEDKELWVRNFIKQAVIDKIECMNQNEL